ncbi:phosphoglycerate dehydrogenase [Opitutaceae bacterium TAV5]|nr:phosphoglycerate dehydrogenase [Opitutaceae bacterium TAV5]
MISEAEISASLTVPPPHPAGRTATGPRVLFSITEGECALFLPDFDAAAITLPLGTYPASPELVWLSPADTAAAKASPDNWLALLRDTRPEVIVTAWSSPPLPDDAAPGFPVRYMCHLAGSVRAKVSRAFIERGGLVSNWGGQVAAQVAEHALFLALASLRRAPEWIGVAGIASAGKIRLPTARTRTLFGRRIGLHGFGAVARRLATLLSPFTTGREIDCHADGVPEDRIREAGLRPVKTLAALFSENEILFECEALTPANRASVDAATLARLPDGALFVNIARGQLVDETALYNEVRSGRLHAALDVMHSEPVSADSPWRTLPGAVLSPHIAGPTSDMMPRIGATALQNLVRYFSGKPLENLVTLQHYDRAT